jgi:hypothetical protein
MCFKYNFASDIYDWRMLRRSKAISLYKIFDTAINVYKWDAVLVQ